METRLKNEIEKWSGKLKDKRKRIAASDGKAKEQLGIADDYISDSLHFLESGQLIESFEALVYAWAIIETLDRLDLLTKI